MLANGRSRTEHGVAPRVFISYRRLDAPSAADWLYHELAKRLGRDGVFKDTDAIQPGADWAQAILTALSSCSILIVVIGQRWLSPRLRDPGDPVRLELEFAATHRIAVIPVLVDGASMPTGGQLPPSISYLLSRNALEIRPNYFEIGLRRLLRVLGMADDEEPRGTTSWPDPANARTSQEFLGLLRQTFVHGGSPQVDTLCRRANNFLHQNDIQNVLSDVPEWEEDKADHWQKLSLLLVALNVPHATVLRWRAAFFGLYRTDPALKRIRSRRRTDVLQLLGLAVVALLAAFLAGGAQGLGQPDQSVGSNFATAVSLLVLVGVLGCGYAALIDRARRRSQLSPRQVTLLKRLATLLAVLGFASGVLWFQLYPQLTPEWLLHQVERVQNWLAWRF